jgi:hypothetical protein
VEEENLPRSVFSLVPSWRLVRNDGRAGEDGSRGGCIILLSRVGEEGSEAGRWKAAVAPSAAVMEKNDFIFH